MRLLKNQTTAGEWSNGIELVRGQQERTGPLFSYISTEDRIPAAHPLRQVRRKADQALDRLNPPTYGSFSIREMNLRVGEFLDDIDIVSAKFLAGNDTIIGTNFADKLDGHKGNDTIYGGRGNDQIIGGTGTNQVWGQGGRDTFYVGKGAGHSVVRDFKKGEDKIAFLSGTSGLKISAKGRDAYIYQNNDLMAIVNGASGQLNLNGSALM